jgi:hypothetical protein
MAIYSCNLKSIGRTTHEPGTAGAHIRYISREEAAPHIMARHMPAEPVAARTWMDQRERAMRKNARVIEGPQGWRTARRRKRLCQGPAAGSAAGRTARSGPRPRRYRARAVKDRAGRRFGDGADYRKVVSRSGQGCVMKDPKHPLGPAFAQAQDEPEMLRRQQIAALTQPQRTAYDALCRRQEAAEDRQRQTLQSREKQHIAERAERHLWRRDLQPRPRGAPHKEQLSFPQASPHERAARANAADQFIRQRLQEAQTKARAEVAAEHSRALERMQASHQRARDGFLERAGRERYMPPDKARQFQGNAPELKWHQALEKAARQEQDRKREQERGTDYSRDYRYGR